jgi:hypothetical protein
MPSWADQVQGEPEAAWSHHREEAWAPDAMEPLSQLSGDDFVELPW